jgi:hypothetical protein
MGTGTSKLGACPHFAHFEALAAAFFNALPDVTSASNATPRTYFGVSDRSAHQASRKNALSR